MIGCSYHCAACTACFSSLEAFDAHRQFEEGHPDDWNHRVCAEPMDDARFGAKTRVGVCNLARPKKRATVIWTLVKNQQRWRERGAVELLTPSEAPAHPKGREAA